MNIDLNRLAVFYQVYANQSFGKASSILHITQSAVSQHIKKLETETGHKLFIRNNKQVLPTNAAFRLFEVIHPFLADLKTSLAHLDKLKDEPGGLLRIGAPVEFGSKFLTQVMSSFLNLYPSVSFELHLGAQGPLCERLNQNQLDLVFVDVFSETSSRSSPFLFRPVLIEHLLLIGTPSFLKWHKITASPHYESLIKAPHFSYLPNFPDLKNWYGLHFKGKNPDLPIAVTVENVQAMITLVQSSAGLGLIPDYLIEDALDKGSLIELFPHRQKITNKISLVQLKNKTPSMTEKLWIKHFLSFRDKRQNLV